MPQPVMKRRMVTDGCPVTSSVSAYSAERHEDVAH